MSPQPVSPQPVSPQQARQPLPALLGASRAPAPRTLVDIFLETVSECPDALAIDSGVQTLTYSELFDQAEAVAEELAALGVGPGDKVADVQRRSDRRR